MTLSELDSNVLEDTKEKDDEFSIPLNISDIISICKDFNSLGWQVQNQIDNIIEIGIEESIKKKYVEQQSLPRIKFFLQQIIKNPYFGEAVDQATECIKLIREYEYKHKVCYNSKYN